MLEQAFPAWRSKPEGGFFSPQTGVRAILSCCNHATIAGPVLERFRMESVHTAAQPSHDRAAAIPFDDFDTNAVGTLNLSEAARQFCPESPFIHMSTNKVSTRQT